MPKERWSIQLIDHHNPSSKDYGGSCCDFAVWCSNDCDNLFVVNLLGYNAPSFFFLDPSSIWKSWSTYVVVDDNEDFQGYGQSIGPDGLTNPLTYKFTRGPLIVVPSTTGVHDVKSSAIPMGNVSSLFDVSGVSARPVSSRFHFSQGDACNRTQRIMVQPTLSIQ